MEKWFAYTMTAIGMAFALFVLAVAFRIAIEPGALNGHRTSVEIESGVNAP